MINVINVPTRQHAFLDPILIPNDMEYSDSGMLPLPQPISNHSATYISIPFPYELQKCCERTIWLYSRATFESLNQKIENDDWSILHVGSVDDCFETFTGFFYEIDTRMYSIQKKCVSDLMINPGMTVQLGGSPGNEKI